MYERHIQILCMMICGYEKEKNIKAFIFNTTWSRNTWNGDGFKGTRVRHNIQIFFSIQAEPVFIYNPIGYKIIAVVHLFLFI